MQKVSFKNLVFAALMTAICVILSPMFSFPLGVARVFPLQHMINIFLATLIGTKYATAAAFATSLIRNIIGSGSLLAFPGSMIGAFLSGILFSRTKKLLFAVIGEFIGTSIIGGLISYPIASIFMGSTKGATFYVSVFAISCGVGCVIAYIVLSAIKIAYPNLLERNK